MSVMRLKIKTEFLNAWLAKNLLSQTELARIAGVHPNWITLAKNPTSPVFCGRKNAIKMLNAMGMSLEERCVLFYDV
jgi:hypothetical protein